MIKRLVLVVILLIIIILTVLSFVLSNNDFREIAKTKAPQFLLNSYSYIYQLINSKKILENKIKNYEILLEYEKTERIKKELIIENFPKLIGNIKFELKENNNLLISDKKLNYKRFESKYLFIPKNDNIKATGYIEYHNSKVIIASATGIFSYVDFKNLKNNEFDSSIMKTNIKSFINNNEFYTSGRYGIKDLLIFEDNIFVSYTNQIKKDCYNTSILYAKFNLDNLKFKKLFNPNFCSKNKSRQNGGRIFGYKKNKILFTHGDYRDPIHSVQDNENILGKIFVIDLNSKNYELISKGHRNPQGLFYDKDRDIVYSTEHGPKGGDEVNVNFNPDTKEIKNYGWPISSYGVHYGEDRKGEFDARYVKEPLYKSHKDYGFIEPLKYFTPSIGISEIIKLKRNTLSQNHQLWVAAMGNKAQEGDLSIHILDLDNDKIINHQTVLLNQRIRDMLYIENEKVILLFLETSASLGVIFLD